MNSVLYPLLLRHPGFGERPTWARPSRVPRHTLSRKKLHCHDILGTTSWDERCFSSCCTRFETWARHQMVESHCSVRKCPMSKKLKIRLLSSPGLPELTEDEIALARQQEATKARGVWRNAGPPACPPSGGWTRPKHYLVKAALMLFSSRPCCLHTRIALDFVTRSVCQTLGSTQQQC